MPTIMKLLKYFFIGIIIFSSCISISAQTNESVTEFNDSISGYTELGETVVEAARNITNVNKTIVFPDQAEKAASIDAYSLLKRITIPNIMVGKDQVNTLGGEDVSIYINGIPASEIEMKSIDVKTITKVEYIDYPQDPIYFGAAHVLNITTKKPEYGGFTNVKAIGQYIDKFNYLAYLMSKLNYKRMTYDIILNNTFIETNKGGSIINQNFKFKNGEILDESQEPIRHYDNYESFAGNFRAVYSSDNVNISNTIGLFYADFPKSLESSLISYNNYNKLLNSNSSSHAKYLSPAWEGIYSFNLPRDFVLSFRGTFAYSRNNRNNREWLDNEILFDNRIKEDSYNYTANLGLKKSLNKAGIITFTASYSGDNYKTHYNQLGVLSSQAIEQQGISPKINYSLPISKVTLQLNVGAKYIRHKINETTTSSFIPLGVLSGYWNHENHSLSFDVEATTNDIESGKLNPTLIQYNDYIYTQGNPELKTSPEYKWDFSYSFAPLKSLQLTAWVSGQMLHNIATMQYVATDNYVIKTFTNSGDYYSGVGMLRATWRPLNGRLVIDLVPFIEYSRISGINKGKEVVGRFTGAIYYYLKNWNFGVYYNSDSKDITSDGIKTSHPAVYGLKIGWNKENWNLELLCANPFRNSWIYSRSSYTSPVYSYNSKIIGEQDSHRYFFLTIGYTFNYGRKVSHDTLNITNTSSTSIL